MERDEKAPPRQSARDAFIVTGSLHVHVKRHASTCTVDSEQIKGTARNESGHNRGKGVHDVM